MPSLGYMLVSIIASIHFAWPIILIILVVALISRANGKKTVYGRVKPGEVLTDEAQAAQNEYETNKRLNILLYVGSFFIAGSMLLLAKDSPDTMPLLLVAVTLITYGAGLMLYQREEYLQPVAVAFTYTSLVLFPIWYYAFQNVGLSPEVALLISSGFSFLSSLGAAIVIESNIAGWLAYIWLIFTGWIAGSNISETFSTYAFFLWPLIVAILPNIWWSFRVKWLPVALRRATKGFAEILVPTFTVITLISSFTPQMANDYPALRIGAGLLATVNGLISYISSKQRAHLAALRFYTQFLLIAAVADIVQYPSYDSYSIIHEFNANELVVAIVWLVSFLAQAVISLFIPQKDEKEHSIERGTLIASLIGIFLTSAFCTSFNTAARSIMIIALLATVAILGVLVCIRYRDLRWLTATVVASMFIPLEIGMELIQPSLGGWSFFAIYAVLTLIFTVVFLSVPQFKRQQKAILPTLIYALTIGNLVCTSASFVEGWASAGLIMAAIDIIVVVLLTKKYKWLEATVYLFAAALYCLITENVKNSVGATGETALMLNTISWAILTLPILGFGFYKERGSDKTPRLITGYILFTLAMFSSSYDGGTYGSYLWTILFIAEQAALLIAGVITKRTWITVASTVMAILAVLDLTEGLDSSIWLLLIGVGLIAFVGVQLSKNNKAQKK